MNCRFESCPDIEVYSIIGVQYNYTISSIGSKILLIFSCILDYALSETVHRHAYYLFNLYKISSHKRQTIENFAEMNMILWKLQKNNIDNKNIR